MYRSQGKASGNKAALWLRTKLQWHLFHLGRFVQRHAGKVLFVGLLVLSTFCVGLKSASVQTDVEKLWVEGESRPPLFVIVVVAVVEDEGRAGLTTGSREGEIH